MELIQWSRIYNIERFIAAVCIIDSFVYEASFAVVLLNVSNTFAKPLRYRSNNVKICKLKTERQLLKLPIFKSAYILPCWCKTVTIKPFFFTYRCDCAVYSCTLNNQENLKEKIQHLVVWEQSASSHFYSPFEWSLLYIRCNLQIGTIWNAFQWITSWTNWTDSFGVKLITSVFLPYDLCLYIVYHSSHLLVRHTVAYDNYFSFHKIRQL